MGLTDTHGTKDVYNSAQESQQLGMDIKDDMDAQVKRKSDQQEVAKMFLSGRGGATTDILAIDLPSPASADTPVKKKKKRTPQEITDPVAATADIVSSIYEDPLAIRQAELAERELRYKQEQDEQNRQERRQEREKDRQEREKDRQLERERLELERARIDAMESQNKAMLDAFLQVLINKKQS